MNPDRNILIAVDDSEASTHAVTYVAMIIGERQGFHVCLFHVLPSFPPELLEVGGSENPEVEAQEEAAVKAEQATWLAEAEQQVTPTFERAKTILRDAGMPAEAIATQSAIALNGESVVTHILDTARTQRCNTVVVGRESFHGLKALFTHHVGDELLRKGQGLVIWVVE